LTGPAQGGRVARSQRAGTRLEGHSGRLRVHRHGRRLSGGAPRAPAGQFILGSVGQAAGRPGAAGRELSMPAATGGALVGIGRGPGQGGAAEAGDRRRRSHQGHHRCRVRHGHLYRPGACAAGACARKRIAGIRAQRRRGPPTRGGLDAAPSAGRCAALSLAGAPRQGRRLTHRHRAGGQLHIDRGFHGLRSGPAPAEVKRIPLAASSERRDRSESNGATQQAPGNRAGALASALAPQVGVQPRRTRNVAIASS
jgi:hypothetical protein